MIIVKNDRSVYIPEADRHIGFENDHLVESRLFQINDKELFDFSFKLDIKNTLDIVDLVPYVSTEDSLVLRWDISSPVIGKGGIITAQIRAFNADDERVWHSAVFELVAEASVNAEKEANNERTITEFEQLEARVQTAVEGIEDSAVQAKQYAENASQSNNEAQAAKESAVQSNSEAQSACRSAVQSSAEAQAAMTSVTATAGRLLNLEKEYTEMTGGYTVISDTVKNHCGNTGNPHGVTAEQTGAYTKSKTDELLGGKASLSHTHTASETGAYSKEEIDLKIGDIDTALDAILAMQQSFTGGETA